MNILNDSQWKNTPAFWEVEHGRVAEVPAAVSAGWDLPAADDWIVVSETVVSGYRAATRIAVMSLSTGVSVESVSDSGRRSLDGLLPGWREWCEARAREVVLKVQEGFVNE